MASYAIYRPKLAKHEGGYANDSRDNGGETYKGVARKIHPTWVGWSRVDMHKAKYSRKVPWNTKFVDPILDKMVDDFFLVKFWNKYAIGDIKNQSIAEILADFFINGVTENRIKEIQAFVGTTPDGDWYEFSSEAVNKYAKTKDKAQKLFDFIKKTREKHYRLQNDFSWAGTEWLRRLNSFTLDFSTGNKVLVGILLLTGVAYWQRDTIKQWFS
jgi:lysozyme family protein